MKSSKEIANAVFQARDAYHVKQQIKNTRIKRAAAISGTACVLCLTVAGVGYWHAMQVKLKAVQRDAERMTDKTIVEGEETNMQATPLDSTEDERDLQTDSSNLHSGSNDVCDIIGMVIVDGVTYVQFDAGTELYTPDTYLGAASDFEGSYQTFSTDIPGKLYTAKENPEVLIVKLENGGVVTLIEARE